MSLLSSRAVIRLNHSHTNSFSKSPFGICLVYPAAISYFDYYHLLALVVSFSICEFA